MSREGATASLRRSHSPRTCRGIRGDVMSNHGLAVLGDCARAPCRSLRAVHRASRDRAFCGRAFRDLQTARQDCVHCSERRVLVPHEGDVLVARRVGRTGRRVLALERRVLLGLREDRAERPAGPRGEARCTESVVRVCDAAAVEARVASAVGATERTPLPVSRERTIRWSSLMLMCSALALERRVLVGLREDRAKGPAGPRGEARRMESVVRACDGADDVARVASAVGATGRRRCPCRVSAHLGGREARSRR
jgi:hypothetical protein